MFEFFRDSIWQFVFGFLAVIITVIVYRLQRNRKIISYRIIAQTQLLSVDDEVKGQLQVLYNGKVVQDVSLVMVRVQNSGNLEILKSDYDYPITLRFGDNAEILSAEVRDFTPKSLNVSIKEISANTITIEPSLLNSKDEFTLKVVLTDYSGNVDISARIIGVREIVPIESLDTSLLGVLVRNPSDRTARTVGYSMIFMALFLPICCFLVASFVEPFPTVFVWLSFVPLVIIVVGFIIRRSSMD